MRFRLANACSMAMGVAARTMAASAPPRAWIVSAGSSSRGVHGVAGAQLAGDGELRLEDVDGGDGRAGDLGVLHRKMTEPADAEHGDEIGRAGAGHLHGLVRRDAGARERRGVERVDAAGYEPGERRLGQHVLGEAAVDGVARVLRVGAERLPSGGAELTGTACPTEPRHRNAIAFVQIGHAGPDAGDDADALVPGYERRSGLDRPVTTRRMDVRVAEPGRLDLDQHLPVARLGGGDLLDHQRAVELVDDSSLHRGPPRSNSGSRPPSSPAGPRPRAERHVRADET